VGRRGAFVPVKEIESLIAQYGLQPHPEGGYYKETYRSSGSSSPAGFDGPRSFATAIYFLIPEGQVSHLHRIKSDEIWHFYAGGPLTIVEISPEGMLKTTTLGPDNFQYTVPAGVWFGSLPAEGSTYSLVGCTVSPGFDFADFELAERATLLAEFPTAATWIKKLT
jgi:predicted cupin superfamily sugar epimerase